MKEITVTFETLTPLWTGDAWGENSEIRPSSLMGSLRFWFEVINYFSNTTSNDDYNNGKLKANLSEKDFRKKLKEYGNDFIGIDMALAECDIPLPARVFGCTGWKGWIRIKEIEFDDKNFKRYFSGRIINGKNWFWKPISYQGDFKLTFQIKEDIIEPIFYPLLTFMEKYGFWGGGWNIGYGRLKVKKVELNNKEMTNWHRNNFEFSRFKNRSDEGIYGNKDIDDFIISSTDFLELEDIDRKILYRLENQITNNKSLPIIIKELIRIKARGRLEHKNKIKDNELRHLIFGTTKSPPTKEELPQGTKIIPWIYEENKQFKGGFISIAGILNLGGKSGKY